MIAIKQSHDVGFFNRMVNHPAISPFVRDDTSPAVIDCTPFDTPDNVMLEIHVDGNEAGFAVMVRKAKEIFEMHSGILPEFRANNLRVIGREIMRWMMQNTPCKELQTYAWSTAKNVIVAARLIGFQEISREDWPNTVAGSHVLRVNFSTQL